MASLASGIYVRLGGSLPANPGAVERASLQGLQLLAAHLQKLGTRIFALLLVFKAHALLWPLAAALAAPVGPPGALDMP